MSLAAVNRPEPYEPNSTTRRRESWAASAGNLSWSRRIRSSRVWAG